MGRSRLGVGIILTIVVIGGSVASPAAAGDSSASRAGRLDTSFGGGDGAMTVPRYSGVSPAQGETLVGLFVRPGGAFRTVTAGYASTPTGPAASTPGYVTVRGYRANGTVDPAFNRGAPRVLRNVISTSPGPGTGVVRTAMDSSGRIVVATQTYDYACAGVCQIRLYRVLADGRVDSTYHPVWARSALPGELLRDLSVAILSDGRARLCLTDDVNAPPPATTWVFGYSAKGAVETSFGTGEKPGVALLPATGVRCEATTADPAGRLLVSWSYGPGLRVMRLTATGHVDTAFGASGTAQAANWGRWLSPYGITVSGRGSIYVSGQAAAYAGPTTGTAAARSIFVARLYPSGAVATGFGRRGVAIVSVAANRYQSSWAASTRAQRALSVDAALRVYVPIASAQQDATHGAAPGWVRLNGYTGTRDAAWGANGFVALPRSSRADQSAGPVVQVSSTKVLTGATLSLGARGVGAVVQRRWSR